MRTLVFLLLTTAVVISADINVTVEPQQLGRIEHNIFGHFLERPSWQTEFGIEDAIIPGTHRVDPRVLDKLMGLDIPVLRFPGGTDVDYMDWTDMIDLPQRDGRPVSIGVEGDTVTNRFGFDEFYELTETLDCEAIIPLNFFDAFLKRVPLQEAALHQAGLAAYCNARVGQALPDGMRDWPTVRAANGHKEPFRFKYFQIGNETWALWEWKKQMLEQKNYVDPYGWYIECAREYIKLIHEVDPEIRIIADFVNPELFNRFHKELGDEIEYYVYHHYLPWKIRAEKIKKHDKEVDSETLSEEEVWRAFVSTPNSFDEKGMNVARHKLIDLARQNDAKVAVTEWNWNGWWDIDLDYKPLQSFYAHAVGVAGFLHGFMRSSDVIDLACQSMLVGSAWDITGIRVDKQGMQAPYYFPSGQMTSFYAEHHGKFLLKSDVSGVPVFHQPLQLGDIHPQDKVAAVDVLATGSNDRIAVFLINRDFDTAHHLHFDLKNLNPAEKGEYVILTGTLHNSQVNPPEESYLKRSVQPVSVSGQTCSVEAPPRSVSVFQIDLNSNQ
ncbi:MAG: alpha-L-arabinofuranosidase C-terminal domain-containing protein [candidate division KSB1 bacterium]|nr:alpha-L-arabinofuranosidase C-terminal domain-containing protein [candidate division KSB1 bacterium]